MFINKKAYYNLWRLNCPSDEKWETCDYRCIDTNAILHQLQERGVSFKSLEHFEASANDFESPEEMAEVFLEDSEEPDRAFLLLFEIWRRHLPEKRAVSIFCDELDHQISLYYEGNGSQDTVDIIEYLKQVLDDNADSGTPRKQILPALQHASCHDIEAFLYDYSLDQLEGEETEYAQELIEGFYPYLVYPEWFDYLTARLEMIKNKSSGHKHLAHVLTTIKDIDFALEVLSYLANSADSLFLPLAQKALDFLETESDLIELLEICDFYFQEQDFKDRIASRKKKDPDTPIKQTDTDIKKLKEFFSAQN